MTRLRISEVAERTGFTPSALRYYEQHGLVRPGRSESGYRQYGEPDVTRLRFIARAKGSGLSLDEITDVLALLDEDRCAPVQDRLRIVIGQKAGDAEERAAALSTFAAELRARVAVLEGAPADGPCDDRCGCIADPPAGLDVAPPPIACALPAGEVEGRVAAWRAIVDRATSVARVGEGARLRFDATVDAGELAGLAAAEHGCCAFLAFRLDIGGDEVTLHVLAPPGGQPLVDLLVGGAAGS